MAGGYYSAMQVIEAFCKRAAYAHQLVRVNPPDYLLFNLSFHLIDTQR